MKKRIYFLLLLTTLYHLPIMAQDQCGQRLDQAKARFNQGKLYDVPILLDACLEDGFSKEQKIEAYKLLTIVYLYLDYYGEADRNYLNLLKLSPEYQLVEGNDPYELFLHHEKFTTKPKIIINLGRFGINRMQYITLLDYSMTQENNNSQSIGSFWGFEFGMGIEAAIYKNLSIALDAYLVRGGFSISDVHYQRNELENYGFYTSFNQHYTSLDLPLMAKYTFSELPFRPYVAAGIAPSILLRATGTNYTGLLTDSINSRPLDGADINLINLRNNFNLYVTGAIGAQYKIGINYINLELRYQGALYNFTDVDTRLGFQTIDDIRIKMPQHHIDDDFRLGRLSISVGFTKPLYKPRKIKKP
ncbi:MAG: outer membrane beta-barrel protein [Cyclobacteriaceae bacterium]